MDTDFSKASEQHELSDFDIAKAVHEKLRYSKPMTAFEVTRELVVPFLKDLGTPDALATALKALSPDTDNIDIEDKFKFPFEREINKSLRPLVFVEPKRYEETGSEPNKQLARILNGLSDLERKDPIEALKHAATGDGVLHLPKNKDVARDEERVRKRLESGEEFKKETLSLFVSELQGLLYEKRDMIGSRMSHALYRLPQVLTGGKDIEKALSTVINDFGKIGSIIRDGHDLKSAVAIMKRANEMRAERLAHTHDKV